MPAATLSAISSLFGLNYAGQINALDTLIRTIGREVEPAAAKLAEALGEVDRMLSALDEQLVRYLELRFEGPEVDRRDLRALLELEAGQAKVRIEEARGHCSRIEIIYEVHLRRWLYDKIDGDKAADLARVFGAMSDADFGVLQAADEINGFLMAYAEATLDRVLQGDVDGANALVLDARGKALPFRREVFAELAQLRRYQGAGRRRRSDAASA